MLSRLAMKKAMGLKSQVRNFVAMWPPTKGSKVVGSAEEVSFL